MEQEGFSDARFGALLDRLRVTDPNINCPSGNKIVKICSNPQCKLALQCSDYQCLYCGGKIHKFCQSYPLELMNELLNDRAEQSKEFVQKIRELDQRLIMSINQSQKELTSHYQISPFPPPLQKIVDYIYKNKSINAVSGADGKYLFQQTQQINSVSNSRNLALLERYKKGIQELITYVFQLKKKLFSDEVDPKKYDKEKFQNKQYLKYENKIKLNSRILNQDSIKSKNEYQFLIETLKRPRELILLYRASECNFKAADFHKKCGEKKNTLTIIQTEFGKTIAAFTPYRWHSVPDQQFVNNPAGGCFILSLQNQLKLIPHDTKTLIFNNSEDGPVFGAGWDLAISDKCNENKKSGFGYFTTYNTADKKLQNNQASWILLSGSNNSRFKVLEYEVFEVIL